MKRNFFSFKEIGEEYLSYAEDLRRGTPTAVFGVSDTLKYMLASLTPFPVVYVTADRVSARKAAENISSLSGKKAEILVISTGCGLFVRIPLSSPKFAYFDKRLPYSKRLCLQVCNNSLSYPRGSFKRQKNYVHRKH